jgi:hypothetical protein
VLFKLRQTIKQKRVANNTQQPKTFELHGARIQRTNEHNEESQGSLVRQIAVVNLSIPQSLHDGVEWGRVNQVLIRERCGAVVETMKKNKFIEPQQPSRSLEKSNLGIDVPLWCA